MKVSSSRFRCCAICGSTKHIEEHHLGGRNHAPYFTIPLCVLHHREVTIRLQRAGVDMGYTSDKVERFRRIVLACIVLQHYASEQLLSKSNEPKGAKK